MLQNAAFSLVAKKFSGRISRGGLTKQNTLFAAPEKKHAKPGPNLLGPNYKYYFSASEPLKVPLYPVRERNRSRSIFWQNPYGFGATCQRNFFFFIRQTKGVLEAAW